MPFQTLGKIHNSFQNRWLYVEKYIFFRKKVRSPEYNLEEDREQRKLIFAISENNSENKR